MRKSGSPQKKKRKRTCFDMFGDVRDLCREADDNPNDDVEEEMFRAKRLEIVVSGPLETPFLHYLSISS